MTEPSGPLASGGPASNRQTETRVTEIERLTRWRELAAECLAAYHEATEEARQANMTAASRKRSLSLLFGYPMADRLAAAKPEDAARMIAHQFRLDDLCATEERSA